MPTEANACLLTIGIAKAMPCQMMTNDTVTLSPVYSARLVGRFGAVRL